VTDTKAAMEDAIQAHFAAECSGALMSGYVIQMFGSNVEDIQEAGVRTLREVPDTQNIVTTMGLISYMKVTTNDMLAWGADDDDQG
jgi:microcompartment protein CcmL/EutN